jgi:hypothetical protein
MMETGVTGGGKRARLLHYTPVERARQVLHDDEHASAAHHARLRLHARAGSVVLRGQRLRRLDSRRFPLRRRSRIRTLGLPGVG